MQAGGASEAKAFDQKAKNGQKRIFTFLDLSAQPNFLPPTPAHPAHTALSRSAPNFTGRLLVYLATPSIESTCLVCFLNPQLWCCELGRLRCTFLLDCFGRQTRTSQPSRHHNSSTATAGLVRLGRQERCVRLKDWELHLRA